MAGKIIDFINEIEKIYSEFSKGLLYNKNLRKIGISEILDPTQRDFEINFGRFIKKYRDNLESTCYNLIVNEGLNYFCQDPPEVRFNTRIKIQESIMFKIWRNIEKEEKIGKITVYKTLNDLIGLRIVILKDFETKILKIKEELEATGKYRIIDKNKNGYYACHVYTQNSNKIFPLEIQIWDEKYEKSNKDSHEKYKMGYKEFLEIYKNL